MWQIPGVSMRTSLALALLLSACGDDASPDPDAGRPDAGPPAVDAGAPDAGAPDAGPAPPDAGRTVDVAFVATRGTGVSDQAPAAGATVTLDLASGERLEATADEDGRVELEAVALDGASVTAFVDEDHSLASIVELSEGRVAALIEEGHPQTDGALHLPCVLRASRASTLFLLGDAVAGLGNRLGVSVIAPASTFDVRDALRFQVDVPDGAPFTVLFIDMAEVVAPDRTVGRLGTEVNVYGYAAVRSPGIDRHLMRDVDYTDDGIMALDTVGGSFGHARRGGVFETGTTYGFVHDADTLGVVGLLTRMDRDELGDRIELESLYTMPEGVTDLLTSYTYEDPPLLSRLLVPGPPADESIELVFPTPPQVMRPSPGTDSLLGDAVGWRGDDAPHRITVLDARDDLLWSVVVPPGLDEARVPELPEPATRAALFDAEPFRGRVALCAAWTRGHCGELALGRTFRVLP